MTAAPAPTCSTSRYRCRDHPDIPVRWRGSGCWTCDQARQQSQRDRAANRAASRADPETQSWAQQ